MSTLTNITKLLARHDKTLHDVQFSILNKEGLTTTEYMDKPSTLAALEEDLTCIDDLDEDFKLVGDKWWIEIGFDSFYAPKFIYRAVPVWHKQPPALPVSIPELV